MHVHSTRCTQVPPQAKSTNTLGQQYSPPPHPPKKRKNGDISMHNVTYVTIPERVGENHIYISKDALPRVWSLPTDLVEG